MDRWRLLQLIAWLGLGAFCLWGYWRSQQTVTLLLEDRIIPIRTHQRTVGGVLREASVFLRPEDEVSPAPDQVIRPPALIRVRRAQPVRIWVEGRGTEPSRQLQVYTLHRDPEAILRQAGVEREPGDVLWVDGQRWPFTAKGMDKGAPPQEIRIERAAPLVLRLEDGSRRVILTTAPTVGAAFREAGLFLHPADRLIPDPETPLNGGLQVSLFRAHPITVEADGRVFMVHTTARTVRDLLRELGLALHGQDRVIPEEEAALQGGETVRVIRVREDFEIEEIPIPFRVVWEPDPNLELDTRVQKALGRNGLLQRRIRVRYENGQAGSWRWIHG
jgi:uncharacterized protein YabE (DUF348 family)